MQHVYRAFVLGTLVIAMGAAPASALVEKTIYDLQQDLFTVGDSCLVDSVVVIGVDTRPSTYGVYIQEPGGGPYSGILAYRAGVFPAYNNSSDPVAVGDLINVRGSYADFGGLAELENPSLNKLGTVAPLLPIKLPVDSLKTTNPRSEQWEGVLVRVDSVKCTSIDPVFTRTWRFHHFGGPVGGRVDSLSAYEKMISNQVTPVVGDLIASVTGVLDWVSSQRMIAPRNDNDIVFLSPAPPPVPTLAYSPAENKIKITFNVALNSTDAQTPSKYALSTLQAVTVAAYDAPSKSVTLTIGTPLVPSLTPHVVLMSGIRNQQNINMVGTQNVSLIGGICTISFIQTPRSAADDTSQVVGQQVSFRGVVTASGNGTEFPAGTGFYVQQRGITQFGALLVFGAQVTPARGDSVLVSGLVTEFGIGPETEITSVDEVTILNPGAPRPPMAAVVVTPADLTGPNIDSVAERYEGMLVKLVDVVCLNPIAGTTPMVYPGTPFDIAASLAGPDTVRVDDFAISEFGYTPHRGDVLDITGIVRFSGTAPYRRLQPRNWSEPGNGGDIGHTYGVTDAPPPVERTLLAQNEPNPFNPSTSIVYSIRTPGHASLRIYDSNGRFVATLLDRDVKAGPGAVTWTGLDANGRRVPSGVYVYRLTSADGELSRKMVLLK